MLNVSLLISLIQNRPVLWDKSLEGFKSKTETTAAQREVWNHMNSDLDHWYSSYHNVGDMASLILVLCLLSKGLKSVKELIN